MDDRAPDPGAEPADPGRVRGVGPLPRRLPQPAAGRARPAGWSAKPRSLPVPCQPCRRGSALPCSAAWRHRERRGLRLYGANGARLADSWESTGPTYRLRDPTTQKWTKYVAQALDRGFNALVGAGQVEDFAEPVPDRANGLAGAARGEGQRQGGDRGSQCARPDAGLFRRHAAGRRQPAAAHRQRPQLHAHGARGARLADHRHGLCRADGGACCPFSLPAPSSGRCGGSRLPRTACGSAARARSRFRACPRGATRSACSPAPFPT